MALGLVIVLGVIAGSMAPAVSLAVRFTQHAIPKLDSAETVRPVLSIFAGPNGLLVGGARGTAYQNVTTSPTFAVSPGAGSGGARTFFIGPNGQTWYVGGVVKVEGGVSVLYSTLDEVTPGGPILRFTYPSTSQDPLAAATGPDGDIWLVESPTGTLDHYVPGGALTSIPLPVSSSGPVEIVSGPAGDLWTTDITTGAITQITPEGAATEHPLPGDRFGLFGDSEPYGLIVGPDGALWFAEENADAIGRMTTNGELQTFPIPIPAGAARLDAGYPQPQSLAVGPEGAIWFTDPGTSSIGRVAGGVVTEYPIPGGDVVPKQIVTEGSELWFNEAGEPDLGSINPNLPPIEEAAKSTVTLTSSEVARLLAVSGKAATIQSLLKSDGYTASITLPAAGSTTITWTNAKHVTVATGHLSLGAAGTGKLKITLTNAGKKLLEKAKTLKLTAKATATLLGASAVTATKPLVLKH